MDNQSIKKTTMIDNRRSAYFLKMKDNRRSPKILNMKDNRRSPKILRSPWKVKTSIRRTPNTGETTIFRNGQPID
jgi:hypothetical protein